MGPEGLLISGPRSRVYPLDVGTFRHRKEGLDISASGVESATGGIAALLAGSMTPEA